MLSRFSAQAWLCEVQACRGQLVAPQALLVTEQFILSPALRPKHTALPLHRHCDLAVHMPICRSRRMQPGLEEAVRRTVYVSYIDTQVSTGATVLGGDAVHRGGCMAILVAAIHPKPLSVSGAEHRPRPPTLPLIACPLLVTQSHLYRPTVLLGVSSNGPPTPAYQSVPFPTNTAHSGGSRATLRC